MTTPKPDAIMAQPNRWDHLETNPRAMWFFTFEDIHGSAFKQGHHVLPSPGTIQHLGLPECLIHSGHRTEHPYRFDYYMLSRSTKKAMHLKSDRSVLSTWKKYCRKDIIVHIIIRPGGSPSPNQFHAASYNESSAARRNVLGS